MKLKSLAVAALGVSFSVGLALPASAGWNDVPNLLGSCLENVETVACHGSFAGIRAQSTEPLAFASFVMESSRMTFSIRLNNITRTCVAPESLRPIWNIAMSGAGHFRVVINRVTGRCDSAWVVTGSHNKNASAL
jgi:hypothetical protein